MNLDMKKAIYDKYTSNIILSDANFKAFPLRSGQEKGVHLTTSIQYSIKVPARAIRQEKEIKGTQIGKEEVKLLFFVDDMAICIENPKGYTKNISTNISIHYSFRIQNQHGIISCILRTNDERYEREIKKVIPFITEAKTIKYLGINLTK